MHHNGNGSVSISSGSATGHPVHLLGVSVEPPKVPTNYISSAMSTSSGDSSSNNASASLVNFNSRRQSNSSSNGSHPPTMKSFSSIPSSQNSNNSAQSIAGKHFGKLNPKGEFLVTKFGVRSEFSSRLSAKLQGKALLSIPNGH